MYPLNLFHSTVILYTIMHGSIYLGLPGRVRGTGLNQVSVTLMKAQPASCFCRHSCSDPLPNHLNLSLKNPPSTRGHSCSAGVTEDSLSGAYISVARIKTQPGLTPEQIHRIICTGEV